MKMSEIYNGQSMNNLNPVFGRKNLDDIQSGTNKSVRSYGREANMGDTANKLMWIKFLNPNVKKNQNSRMSIAIMEKQKIDTRVANLEKMRSKRASLPQPK